MKKRTLLKKHSGASDLVATIGLCIIVLVICVVLKDQLSNLVTTIVQGITTKAQGILGS